MTQREFLKELRASGLRFHKTEGGRIRDCCGLCPIQALARHKKLDSSNWIAAWIALDLDAYCIQEVLLAADRGERNSATKVFEELCV